MREPILSTDSYGRSQVVYDSSIPRNIRYQWALSEIERLRLQIPYTRRRKVDAVIAFAKDPTRERIGGLSATAWEKKYMSGQLGKLINKIYILMRYAEYNK